MEIDPTVRTQIETFLQLAKRYRARHWRATDFRYYAGSRRKKYVPVRAGSFHFLVDAQTGGIFGTTLRTSARGHIASFLKERDWKRGRIQPDRICVPVHEGITCGVCGRTDSVRDTVVGQRCQHCRGADSRHLGVIRSLGGQPNVNGRPFSSYLKTA